MPLRYPTHKISALERYVAESTTSAAAGANISLEDRTLVRLAFSGNGTIDLVAGTEDGQYRILIAETISGTTRLENSTTVELVDRAWLPQLTGEAIGFIWNATLAKWCELWRSIQLDSSVGVFAKNNSASVTISRGTPVYIIGSSGANPLVTPASNTTEALSAGTMGLALNDIPGNGFGYIISAGPVDNINVGTAAAGDPVYLGASGTLLYGVANKPVAPAHFVKIGNVVKTGTAGSIQVLISNGFELEELHNVLITTPANNEVLTYESATSLWKNKPAGGGSSPAIGGTITGGTAGSVLFVDPTATIAQDNANLFFDNTNNNLGVGTSSPQKRLDVNGSSNDFAASIATTSMAIGNWTGLHFGYREDNNLYRKSAIVFERVDGSARGKIHILNNDGATSANATLSDARITILSSGLVGIGTTSPSSTLSIGASSEFQVNSTGNIVRINNVPYSFPAAQGGASTVLQNNGSGTLTWAAAGGGGSPSIGGTITGGTAGSILFVDPAATIAQDNANLFWDNANNHFGLGTTTPETKLEIAGAEPYITLPTELTSASPVNPTTDKLILIGQRIANRGMLAVKGNVGHETALQPYMGHNKVALWSAIPGQATLPTANGISYTTAVGTLTARTPATTNALTYMHRYGIVSTTVAGNITHQRTGTGTTGQGYFFTGNGTTNRGGFVYVVRFATSDATIITGARMFIGLRNDTAAPTNVAPNTIPNCVGIAQYDGTTQLYIVYGGTSAQAAINLGASFVASNSTPYELALYSPSSATRTIYYEVTNLDTGVIATGTLTGTAVQVPSETLLLTGHHWRTNNATASAVALDICQIYAEMDQ